ncbi:alpha-galactosidase [Segetibacter aerophilus]|uniref:Alpha-galactosidase n=1 Tax=Segetibacter aerophilus TaxID=670293 RepID=A0A512BJ58_9BACT|nr:alpha-galactosidase [Segetibacter aerophilus]GEO11915.1 alpha-galactosidase [Segetibacter aerophilus]
MNVCRSKKLLSVLFTFSVSISFAQRNQIIPIETQHNVIALQVGNDLRVSTAYFGTKLKDTSEYRFVRQMYRRGDDYSGILNSAYTPAGSRNLVEPAIEVRHANGNTSLDLYFVSSAVEKTDANVSVTNILLRDSAYALEVSLFFKVYYKEDVVEQWTVIRNKEKGNVTLQKYASANLYLTGDQYWLKQFHGDWAKEMQPEVTRLTAGIKVLDTKLGTRAHLYQPPTFMVSLDKPATEDEGKVLLGQLEWSGNFKVDLEVDPLNNLRLIAGINPFASEYTLKPNQQFETPAFVFTFSDKGTGEASRNLHRWARNYKLYDGKGDRMTLLNNWEATFFNFDEPILAGLLKDTKKLGVDLFLLDDGWFGNNYPRNNDRAGLGDWQENVKKLPHGVGFLVREAENNGVKFGIWVEPEMVNPKSDLYLKHPEWVIKQPNRQEHLYRNQLVLDLSNPKVQNFVFGILDTLFTKNPNLAFIKWDCNAVIYNAYSSFLEKQSHLYVDYVKGLYNVLDRVRAKYPKVEMMLCSGGGGRVDYGALKYFNEFWLSDNTDPLERVFIQYEYSYFYPAISHSNHVTDWGKQPLKYRTDVAMMGKLGFDIVVSKLSPKDLEFAQKAVKTYDSIKTIIWQGDMYRLADPRENPYASVMYVNELKDKAVMFNYITSNRYGAGSLSPIKLKGLDPAKKYKIREINIYQESRFGNGSNNSYSGDYLMTVGYNPGVNSNRMSVVLQIEEAK